MQRIQLLFLAFFLSVFVSSAQDKGDPKSWFVEAESYFLFHEYKDALPLYQQILRADPDNYNVIYKVGLCYLNDTYQKEKATSYLEKAAAHITRNYKLNTYKERLAPPEVRYYLGKAYHINGRFNEAIENYQRFLESADPAEFDLDMVKDDIEACMRAKKVYNDPVYCNFKNFGNTINSRFEDINPVLSGDGKVLAFTRKMQFYDGVFVSVKRNDGSWSEPFNLTGDFGLDGSSVTTGISYYGDEIFVYRSDNFDGNIYSSKRINNKWSKLTKLNSNINTRFWESHASPSPDGQTLIFTSNRDGGYGGLDIYKSKRTSNGDWGPAVNMGPVVNSPFNEETPFLSNEGNTLFFSSEGHSNIGGYDIFMSRLGADGTWSKPYNMGYPVNTADDDLFYYPVGVDYLGLYSYFDKNTEGLLDIYSVEVYNMAIPRKFSVKGRINVENEDEKILKKLVVKLLDAKTGRIIEEQTVNNKGEFKLETVQGEYRIVVEGPGVQSYTNNFDLLVSQPDSEIKLPDISLARTDLNIPATLQVEKPAPSQIMVKKKYFHVTDSLAIPIELTFEKKSDLEVIARINDQVISSENIAGVKKRFTYFYKPGQGENVITFTATDPDGQVASTVVTIVYNPKPEVPSIAKVEEVARPEASQSLSDVADGKLRDYLSQLDMAAYDNYFGLYLHLIDASEKAGFTSGEINNLFSVFFTQKDGQVFFKNFKAAVAESDTHLIKPADTDIPLAFLKGLISGNQLSKDKMMEALVRYNSNLKTDPETFYFETMKYASEGRITAADEFTDHNQVLKKLIEENDRTVISNALMLYSTTDDLNFFYQNLLLNSTNGLHNFLSGLQPEPADINTSIDLVRYLLENAEKGNYSSADLFKTLELARQNKNYYIDLFISLMEDNGEGTLKAQLIEMRNNKEGISRFEDVINQVIYQSKFKNYTPENVYRLLIDLIGIDDVNEFINKIKSYGYVNINRAVGDTLPDYISNPYELIQYLLAATRTYDFTTADINNLLIRMILEQGLSDRGVRTLDKSTIKIWKSKEFLTTFILVNIVLVILILLFALRRRGKKTDTGN